MNYRRLLGISIVLLAFTFVVGSSSYVGGQDKDKDKDKQAKDKEKKDKVETPPKKDKVETPPKKDKVETPPKDVKQPEGAWAFKAFDPKGKKFYSLQNTWTKQEMKVMNQVVVQEQDQTFLIEWTPMDKDNAGNYQVAQKIVGVKMKIDIGGNKIGYDSTNPQKQKNPMTDFFDQLLNKDSTLTYTISPDLEVKSIEGGTKFIKGLSDINPQMQSLLKAILSDKALTKMAEPTWYAFPPKGVVPPTKTWTRTSTLDLGPIGKYETHFDFTDRGPEANNKEREIIDIKTKMTYFAPTEKAGLPFIIKSASLSSDSGTGEAIFDKKLGRFVSTKINVTKLSGKLKIEVGNMETEVDLNQEQKATSTTLDEIPAEWTTKK